MDDFTRVLRAPTAAPPTPEEALARAPVVVYVAEGDHLAYVSAQAERVLGRIPTRLADLDGSGLHHVRRVVHQDGVERTYGALVEPPPLPAAGALPEPALLREALRLAAARARAHDRRVAVLHVGLDGLELVDTALGAAAREAVAREAAARIRSTLAETELVAALGDGELAVLLADLDGEAEAVAQAVAGQVDEALRTPLRAGGHEFELGLRVGVSVLPGDAGDEEALLRHARSALHHARRGDDGPIVFFAGATTDALERLLVGARLRRALDRGELTLHFQPIVRLPTEEIAGVEALLRWEDPERGTVLPGAFIDVAEHTGLIEPIGRWVVAACCEQARAWRDEGLALPVTFNASLRQFREAGFVDEVERGLRRHGLGPDALVVEITESTAMRDPACVEPVLGGLRRLGVRVAIDDFGTGHSSLARLRDLPVDLLKIDRAFLRGAGQDGRAADLVHAALGLARALGLTAVAEGVETPEQQALVSERGCTLAQGFHFARPLPAREVTALLRERGVARA